MMEPEGGIPNNQRDDEERRRAAMEEFLRRQEEQEDEPADDAAVEGNPVPQWMENADQQQQQQDDIVPASKPFRLSYVKTSFFFAFAMLYYALRTRQQWYLALVYLSSSKWAYVVMGNALVATLVSVFSIVTNMFLNGLRLQEAEGLGDFFRWNITETCLALTMFRSELTVQTGILFLILVLAKCLHWVAELREQHLRMTEEAVVVHPSTRWPGLQWPHLKLFMCLVVLQLFDILAVLECGMDILKNGPTVSILFAFESGILLVSVMSSILLWYLHVLDGLFHYAHETTRPGNLFHGWLHPWKDYKATLVFAVEVQAQAAKFFFYVTFFAIVMTYHGLPVNLFREVYMSFQVLKQRIVAFVKYRQLMASMNQFESPTEEELEEAGSTCIICRDEMTVTTTKRLPGCGHLFHKSCLREWLVQQQSCPTCRGDISQMQERQRQRDAAAERQRQAEEEQRQQSEDQSNDNEAIPNGEEEPESITKVESASLGATGPEDGNPSNLKTPPPYASVSAPGFVGLSTEAEEDSDERKPSAPGRISTSSSFLSRNDAPAFPAFYRVKNDSGASVFNDGHVISFEIRVVPYGVVVLGQDLAWRTAGDEADPRLMVHMPDGWIKDSDLERIMAVPLPLPLPVSP